MPIVAAREFDLLDMLVLLCFLAHPSIIRWRVGARPHHPISSRSGRAVVSGAGIRDIEIGTADGESYEHGTE
jgi:hypothetical protein